jgi:hypothetical protein
VIALALAAAAFGLLVVAGAGGDTPATGSDPLRDRLNLGVIAIDARIGDERVHSSGTVVTPARAWS